MTGTKVTIILLAIILHLMAGSAASQAKRSTPTAKRPAPPKSAPKRVPRYQLTLNIAADAKYTVSIVSTDGEGKLDASDLSSLITDLPNGGDRFNRPNNTFPKVVIEVSPNVEMIDLWNPITLFRRDRSEISLVLSLGNSKTGTPKYPVSISVPWISEKQDVAVKPNPLTLLVSLSDDGKILLNTEPSGTLTDPSPLSKALSRIFREREANGVFRPGLNEIEKSVTIVMPMGPRKVTDLITVATAVWEPGGGPISLVMDDPMGATDEFAPLLSVPKRP